MITFKEVT